MSAYIYELRALVGHRPLILVGANVLIVDAEGRLLLMERADTKDWGLPGGFMEPGESLEETAKREVEEETGLHIGAMRLFGVFSGPEYFFTYPNGDQVWNVAAVFLTSDVQGDLKADLVESQSLRFFSLEDLPDAVLSADKPIVEQYARFAQSNKEQLSS